jgi:hypothetical protein
MHHIGKKDLSLWDDKDNFYDVVEMSDGTNERLKVRSLVGVIPMFAVEIMNIDLFKERISKEQTKSLEHALT